MLINVTKIFCLHCQRARVCVCAMHVSVCNQTEKQTATHIIDSRIFKRKLALTLSGTHTHTRTQPGLVNDVVSALRNFPLTLRTQCMSVWNLTRSQLSNPIQSWKQFPRIDCNLADLTNWILAGARKNHPRSKWICNQAFLIISDSISLPFRSHISRNLIFKTFTD